MTQQLRKRFEKLNVMTSTISELKYLIEDLPNSQELNHLIDKIERYYPLIETNQARIDEFQDILTQVSYHLG